MATDAQLAANLRNAHASTGPRTAAGKSASARNSTTHGLFAKRDFVRPRERAAYQALGERYFAELRPEGIAEEDLVLAIVSASWRMRRCSRTEEGLVAINQKDPMVYAWHRDAQNSVDRGRSQAAHLFRRSLSELRRLQNDRFLAEKLLGKEHPAATLPALPSPKHIVSVIRQHNRLSAKSNSQETKPELGSFCKNETLAPPRAPGTEDATAHGPKLPVPIR